LQLGYYLYHSTFAPTIDSIFHTLREQDAPGYSATAHSTCEEITMSFTDSEDNLHSLPVVDYYKTLLQGGGPFLEDPTFQYDLANHFVHHLKPSIQEKFATKCTDHLTFADLSHDAQMHQLAKYLRITTECEKEIARAPSVSSTPPCRYPLLRSQVHECCGHAYSR
jgi:hypothetical protein